MVKEKKKGQPIYIPFDMIEKVNELLAQYRMQRIQETLDNKKAA